MHKSFRAILHSEILFIFIQKSDPHHKASQAKTNKKKSISDLKPGATNNKTIKKINIHIEKSGYFLQIWKTAEHESSFTSFTTVRWSKGQDCLL